MPEASPSPKARDGYTSPISAGHTKTTSKPVLRGAATVEIWLTRAVHAHALCMHTQDRLGGNIGVPIAAEPQLNGRTRRATLPWHALGSITCVDTVASVTGSFYPGSARPYDVTITTESGDAWSCSHENRSTLRIAAP